MPVDLAMHVEESVKRGVALYLLDKASAIGTDVLAMHVGRIEDTGAGGYITVREGNDDGTPKDSFLVLFFSRDDSPRILFRIRVSFHADTRPTFEKLDPPITAPPSMLPIIRARQTAIGALLAQGTPRQPVNPVVLPGSRRGEEGIVVYLLAGTTRPGVVVFGRHYYVLVSEDGRSVRQFVPLSKSVLEVPYTGAPPGAQSVGVFVTHWVTEWPLETHVFASLLHQFPIEVVTARGVFRVDGAKITLVENMPSH